MAKNKMSDLRDHLFEVLEQLKDKESPLDLDRARVVCEVSKNLIESAKVEVQFLKVIGAEDAGTGFFGRRPEIDQSPTVKPPTKPRMISGGGNA